VPSDKRARQRASRDAKRLEEAKQARRRTLIRNGVIVVVIAAVVVGLIVYFSSRGNSSSTTTTTTSTTSKSATSTAQAKANSLAVAAGCPASTSARTNTLTWSSPPAMTIDPTKTYKAKVTTTAGTFTITLLAKTAPNTVNNFVFLSKQNYYKCNTFHRVIPGFMDQTGDPTGTGTGGPGYKFANENVPKAYATGEVAMANSGTTPSNGSQFFILAPGGAATLDSDLASGGGYSLFGKVVTGQSVVNTINSQGNSTASSNGTPPKVTQRILKVTITTS
jgi:peptidylprolyl isomerase/peptidyl-prolyl cis-trans isomerase B (cyclophilin B)